MKKNSFLWAALSMTAALVMTACSNDDNANESPVQQSTVKTIPYSVTVNEGATTRATVESDNKTLKFAVGDKLYISGTDIQGVLYIQSGTGTTFATFSGYLTYSGSGTPASDLSLTATLVSAQQNVGTEVSVDAAGAVTVNYPTTSYCGDVAEAVQKYSNLTGTSTYGMKSFSLTQQTAFLNFVITFEDGTTTGTGLSAVVSNNSTAICTANVTTTTESEKVVAKFVLPVASGTTLSSATVTMGSKAALNITNATLTGKVYNVRKTQAAATYTMAANAVAGDVGKLICTDGHIHTYNADAACTKSRVAKIIYIGTTGHATYSHGLALALTDEGQMTWGAAMTACNTTKNTNTPVTDATWLLASQEQWDYMLGTNGAGSYTALRDGFTSVGGSNLQSDFYWSSTVYNSTYAWCYTFVYGYWNDTSKGYGAIRVRACLAF
ncbi:MAG: hypothetical protein IKH01_10040 [Prevotella sp.]|nr:hypothetical protein [Prevotella sp.]MBR3656517.1 hypothetical protein [Prevotella sp.]